MTIEQGRAAITHYRDKLGLTNREMSRVFQDRISMDAFVNWMNGDNSALSDAQTNYLGNEAVYWAQAEDLDREAQQRRGLTPEPGVREAIGFANTN